MGVPDMVFLCDTGLMVCFSLQVCHTSQLTLSVPLLDCFLQSTFLFCKKTLRKLSMELFTKNSDVFHVTDNATLFFKVPCHTVYNTFVYKRPGFPAMSYLCYRNLDWSSVTI